MGNQQEFKSLARALGKRAAEQGLTLVYGGGHVGLMGEAADGAVAAGGEVIGIIPEFLHEREVGHQGLTELHIVPDMHTRKKLMFDRSDAFVVLPGGIGTVDETIEIMTWRQLEQHDKPIIVLDFEGYWQPFLHLLEQIVQKGFAGPETLSLIDVVDSLNGVFDVIDHAPSPRRPAQSDRI